MQIGHYYTIQMKIFTIQIDKIKFCNVHFNWHTFKHTYIELSICILTATRSYKRKYTFCTYHHDEIL